MGNDYNFEEIRSRLWAVIMEVMPDATYREIADYIGITLRSTSRLLGDRSAEGCKTETLWKFCKAFNTSADFILYGRSR